MGPTRQRRSVPGRSQGIGLVTAPPLEGRSDSYWRRSTEPCRLAFCCRRNLRELVECRRISFFGKLSRPDKLDGTCSAVDLKPTDERRQGAIATRSCVVQRRIRNKVVLSNALYPLLPVIKNGLAMDRRFASPKPGDGRSIGEAVNTAVDPVEMSRFRRRQRGELPNLPHRQHARHDVRGGDAQRRHLCVCWQGPWQRLAEPVGAGSAGGRARSRIDLGSCRFANSPPEPPAIAL